MVAFEVNLSEIVFVEEVVGDDRVRGKGRQSLALPQHRVTTERGYAPSSNTRECELKNEIAGSATEI